MLLIIGTIRVIASMNKKFVAHVLKSLLYREDYFTNKGVSMISAQADIQKASSELV